MILSQVIQALNKKANSGGDNYIPFRYSMMTMVLRDSLGGNCKTKMIATLTADKEDLYESLSTCRFARSVSLIQNKLIRNETVDPGVIISRLKKEVAELKAELAILKGGEQKDHLSAEDIERCNLMVQDFINTNEHKNLVMPDRLMINQCFYHFKTLYKNLEKKRGGAPAAAAAALPEAAPSEKVVVKSDPAQDQEIQRLNMLVKQRDNEIGILLNYLNKKKENGGSVPNGLPNGGDIKVHRATGQNFAVADDPNSTQASAAKVEEQKQAPTLYQMMAGGGKTNDNYNKSIKDRRIEFELNQQNNQEPVTTSALQSKVDKMMTANVTLTMDELADRAKAFEKFRKSYRKNEAMEDNRNLLKDKYARGKYLG